MRKSDVVLALDWMDLGGILNFVYDGGEVAAKIIHCQVDSYVHNGWSLDHHGLAPADVPILADPDRCVAKLLDVVERAPQGPSRAGTASRAGRGRPCRASRTAIRIPRSIWRR